MKRKLLAILAVFGILAMLAIPFATSVSAAAAPTITAVIPADNTGANGHPGQTLIGVEIDGTNFTNPGNTNVITFSNPDITIFGVTWVNSSRLSAAITIAGNATSPAPTDISISNSNGAGGPFSNLFQIINHVPVFPEPVGANTEGVAVAITAIRGGVPFGGQVQVGDVINYQIVVAMPPQATNNHGFNFFGGTIAVRLPNSSTTYIDAAGFGSAGVPASPSNPTGSTPWMPVVPEITVNDLMFVTLPFSYTVSASDQVLDSGVMRLMAYVDYGVPEFPAGTDGTFEDGNPNGTVGAHAGAANGLIIVNPGPPTPELPAGVLFGMGLVGIGGFVILRRYRHESPAR